MISVYKDREAAFVVRLERLLEVAAFREAVESIPPGLRERLHGCLVVLKGLSIRVREVLGLQRLEASLHPHPVSRGGLLVVLHHLAEDELGELGGVLDERILDRLLAGEYWRSRSTIWPESL